MCKAVYPGFQTEKNNTRRRSNRPGIEDHQPEQQEGSALYENRNRRLITRYSSAGSGLEKFLPSCYKLINNSNTFLNGGDGVMKKLFSCLAILGGVFGIVSYLNKYGLPILGNLTMHIPIKLPFDFWDLFTKGIEVAEGKINL